MSRPRLHLLAAILTIAASGASADVINADVCVFGATSGGVTAAVQAARQGKSVALLSTNTHVGGMMSAGLGSTDVGITASIGGLALEFYQRIGARYGVSGPKFTFEPHVAEEEFNAMLTAAGVTLRTNQRLASVTMSGRTITQIAMDDGTIIQAGMFIDTTYEGDLMAAAGVSWTLGRESAATYGESLNGLTAGSSVQQFAVNVDPYVTPGDSASGLLPFVLAGAPGNVGDGDSGLQAYNYRLCLTSTAANRRTITAPPSYSEARYELLGRLIDARVAAAQTITLNDFMTFVSMPNQKSDNNNNGPISTDYIGGNAGYVTATYAQRDLIAQEHLEYIQGLLYYLGHSTRVPSAVRTQMLNYGTCLDEFPDTGGWPHQLYVREARRMVSDYVMQQQNCVGTRMPDDSIGLGSYTIDSHSVQRVVKNGFASNEGIVGRTLYEPYRISYRSIVPRVGECENLLVPWALSASHIGFASIRMEPVFMILSQSAGAAAAFALDGNVPVQQVNYAQLALELAADGQLLTWGSAQPLGIVVDNGDPTGVTFTGAWTSSTSVAGYAGNDYLLDGNTGKGAKSVLFTPTIPTAGDYDVYLRWTSESNRATNVPVDVTHAAGTTTFTVNQRVNGGTWFKLNTAGPLSLPAGAAASVLVRTTGTSGYVVADSVRFAPYVAPAATVQIVASDAVTSELTPANHARFSVVRPSDQTASDWTVTYSVGGTATSGVNFVPLAGSVTIPAGQVAATIDLQAIPDDVNEGDQTVTVTLLPGSGYSVGQFASATATILDKPTIQITATVPTTSEANPGEIGLFTVSRDPSQTSTDWTIAYSVSGTATPGADYTALPGSIVLPAGQTSATIGVAAIPDDIAEGPETVTVTLQPSASFTPGPAASATVTILDKPIDAWRFANFAPEQLANPAISGDNANPDGDAFNNVTEYALGLNPLVAETTATTAAWDASGRLTLTYNTPHSATDVTIITEGSTDLHTWSSDASMVEEVSRVAQGAFDVVTVRLVPLNPARGFLRLRVTRP